MGNKLNMQCDEDNKTCYYVLGRKEENGFMKNVRRKLRKQYRDDELVQKKTRASADNYKEKRREAKRICRRKK